MSLLSMGADYNSRFFPFPVTSDRSRRLHHQPGNTLQILNTNFMKKSGLQKEVLKLYKECIKSVHRKPKEFQPLWHNYVRSEFDKFKGVPKKLFSVIEHLIRVGQRKNEMYLNPQIKSIS